MAYVASVAHLPVSLLEGLRASEGGTVGAATPNRDGQGHILSFDLGPYQVNDRAWIKHFSQVWHRSDEETRALLRDNGCANALAASAIIRGCIDEAHGDIGVAVGLYNSHTPPKAEAYRRHFVKAFLASTSGFRLKWPLPGARAHERPSALVPVGRRSGARTS